MDAQHGTVASPRCAATRLVDALCGEVFFDHQARIEGVCLDRAVPRTTYCAEHYVAAVNRRGEKGEAAVITTTHRFQPTAECERCGWRNPTRRDARVDAKAHAMRHPGHVVTVDVVARTTHVRQP